MLRKVLRSLKGKQSPLESSGPYIYRPQECGMSFRQGVDCLRQSGCRLVEASVDNGSEVKVERIMALAGQCDMDIQVLRIEPSDYQNYCREAGYETRYPEYYRDNRPEKTFEHCVAYQLLALTQNDIFIDLASEHSPVPEIYHRLSGSVSYSQDIMYPAGIHGNQIGGDACSMPVPDGFANKASLTCSIEHFEGDGDTRLFDELYRVLKPGGQVCVVPFYLYEEAAVQTDPTVAVPAGVKFDAGAVVYCAEGWGNRHGRFYSPESFLSRIALPMAGKFRFDYYLLANATAIDSSCYARFAFVATRLSETDSKRHDAELLPCLSQEVRQRSRGLKACSELGWEAFESLWQEIVNAGHPLVTGQAEYAVQHKHRFYELANAFLFLLRGRQKPRVLECGVSELTASYKRLRPELELHLSDRPVPSDYVGFTEARCREKFACDDFFYADLSLPELLPANRHQQYDLVLCTEVIEHLVVNPVELLAGLLTLLKSDGYLYLTTPNFFRSANLEAIDRRQYPLPPFPGRDANWDAHYHFREYGCLEMMQYIQDAGGRLEAFYFSACWDEGDIPAEDQLGNMVFVVSRR